MGTQKIITLVSDSTGETAYHVLQTALAQFESHEARVVRYADVITSQQIDDILAATASTGGLIFHTLVMPDLRLALMEGCARRGIPCIDVLGPTISQLADWLGIVPLNQAGLTRKLDQSYSRRIMCLEFALRHDDGQNAAGLTQADIVLVGNSRCAKTPLSVYLAYQNLLVGNVPIIEGIEPPSILFDIAPEKIVALTVNPERLTHIRSHRARRMGYSSNYEDRDHIRIEVRHALMLYEKMEWSVVDMTSKSIEEASDEVLALMQARGLLKE
jgi:hypothetical protein